MKVMLRYFLLSALLFISSYTNYSWAQEFTEYSNGLIYDEPTMNALRKIVDAENIKYKKCDPWKDYFSLSQATCNVVSLDSFNVKKAVKDFKANISFDSFCKKYPRAHVQKNLLAIKDKSKGNGGKIQIEFSTLELGDAYNQSIRSDDTTLFDKKLKGIWVYQYSEKGKYFPESVTAFYFLSDFASVKIPEKYSRMIQYSDCMIDTNSTILLPNAKASYRQSWEMVGRNKQSVHTPQRTMLTKYIEEQIIKPRKERYKIDSIYDKEYYSWLDKKDSIIDITIATKDRFKLLLKNAIEESIKISSSDDELESLAMKYDTKEHALQLKRSRMVIGGCSQDSRPRVHAQQIAVLAAETVNWDIFLRAHLDIMNDRFERMTDGSYAWAQRNTYIRELELLDFDVTSLLMGVALRIENPSGNHYFGSIRRLGRALSETDDPKRIEKEMSDAIQDGQLDNYNRILIYYLYNNYIHNISDAARKRENIVAMKTAVSSLPLEYKTRIHINDSDYFKKK